jgi:hypothetical protein
MYFKVRNIIRASTVYPESAENDMKDLAKLFFKMMRGGEEERGPGMEEGEEFEEAEELGEEMFEKRSITGEVIRN